MELAFELLALGPPGKSHRTKEYSESWANIAVRMHKYRLEGEDYNYAAARIISKYCNQLLEENKRLKKALNKTKQKDLE